MQAPWYAIMKEHLIGSKHSWELFMNAYGWIFHFLFRHKGNRPCQVPLSGYTITSCHVPHVMLWRSQANLKFMRDTIRSRGDFDKFGCTPKLWFNTPLRIELLTFAVAWQRSYHWDHHIGDNSYITFDGKEWTICYMDEHDKRSFCINTFVISL